MVKRSYNQFVLGIVITFIAVIFFILSSGNMWAVPVATVGLGLMSAASVSVITS